MSSNVLIENLTRCKKITGNYIQTLSTSDLTTKILSSVCFHVIETSNYGSINNFYEVKNYVNNFYSSIISETLCFTKKKFNCGLLKFIISLFITAKCQKIQKNDKNI